MWGRRRRKQADGAAPPSAATPARRERDRTSTPRVERLRIDGTPVRVNPGQAGFADDAGTGLSLLRIDFRTVGALTDAHPLSRLFRAGVAGDPVELSTVCCLRCHARHSLPAMMMRVEAGRDPVAECQRCGCPDALLIYDPDRPAKGDEPYDVRPLDGDGLRMEHVTIWADSVDLPPEQIRTALDLADHGEEFAGTHVQVLRRRPGDDPAGAQDLAMADIARKEGDGEVSRGALERMRWTWVRTPDHGDLLVVLVTAP